MQTRAERRRMMLAVDVGVCKVRVYFEANESSRP